MPMAKSFVWLFGLEGSGEDSIEIENLKIRRLDKEERTRILSASNDFFARDLTIWNNCLNNFPYVFERTLDSEAAPIGGVNFICIFLSLLDFGEVRGLIQWSKKNGSGGSASSSSVVELFYRLINGGFQTISLDRIYKSVEIGLSKVSQIARNNKYEHLIDPALVDRLYATKRHPVRLNLEIDQKLNVIARATDISQALEYLLNEGANSEIQFRLSMSLAWLLGRDADERATMLRTVKTNYSHRSKRVHGVRLTQKSMKKVLAKECADFDLLFRRALLSKIVSKMEDKEWLEHTIALRLGEPIGGFDRIDWVYNH